MLTLLLACTGGSVDIDTTSPDDTASESDTDTDTDTDSDTDTDTDTDSDTDTDTDTDVDADCSEGGGVGTGYLSAGGLSALLYVPKGLGCAPLFIFGHGADKPGSWFGDSWSDPLGTGLQGLADERGFALLVPGVEEGVTSHGWALNNCSAFGQLIELASEATEIDRDRVYMAGQSAGGFVTAYSTLYCPEHFAKTSVVSAGTGGYFDYPSVAPDPKLAVYVVHDPNDQVVPYSYGSSFAAQLELQGHEVLFEDWELGGGGHSWTTELTPAVLDWFEIQ